MTLIQKIPQNPAWVDLDGFFTLNIQRVSVFDPYLVARSVVCCSSCDISETTESLGPLRALMRWFDSSGGIIALTGYSELGPEIRVPSVARFYCEPESEKLVLRRPPGADPERCFDVLRRFALPILMQAYGAEVMHASAVSGPRGIVAFCGDSGKGKSTLAHSLALQGFSAIADDVVVIDPTAVSPPLCIPVAFRFRLEQESEQAIRHFPVNQETMQIHALCELKRSKSAELQLSRVGEKEAFWTLMRHAFMFSAKSAELKRRSLGRYFQLGSQLPVYHLYFPTDLARLPEILNLCVDQLLGE